MANMYPKLTQDIPGRNPIWVIPAKVAPYAFFNELLIIKQIAEDRLYNGAIDHHGSFLQ